MDEEDDEERRATGEEEEEEDAPRASSAAAAAAGETYSAIAERAGVSWDACMRLRRPELAPSPAPGRGAVEPTRWRTLSAASLRRDSW
jgi:hypothetical protein